MVFLLSNACAIRRGRSSDEEMKQLPENGNTCSLSSDNKNANRTCYTSFPSSLSLSEIEKLGNNLEKCSDKTKKNVHSMYMQYFSILNKSLEFKANQSAKVSWSESNNKYLISKSSPHNYDGVKISIPDRNFDLILERNKSKKEIFKISVVSKKISYTQKVNYAKPSCLEVLNIKGLNPYASDPASK
jgi:hypothetical protein